MWTPDDAVRSVRRYLGMTLDSPPWRLRVERREVRDDERPVGVVLDGPISTQRARTAINQGNVEEILPITISLYPAIATSTDDGIRQGRLEASELKTQINQLFNTGLIVKVGERHFAGPFRIPLWDYEGVAVSGKDKAGPTDPHDVLWVVENSLSVEAIQDPEDQSRWGVIANFRVTLERPGRIPSEDEMSAPVGVEGHLKAR